MAYQDDAAFLDEANLIEIPCEFCNDLFPMILLMEHETACRPDLARFVEPTVAEVEAQFLNLDNNVVSENPIADKGIDPPINRNWTSIAEGPSASTAKKREQIQKISESEMEVHDTKNELNRTMLYIAMTFKIIYMLGTSILQVVWFILKIIFEILKLLWSSEPTSIEKFAVEEEDQEAIEKALLQENETFTFGSSNKDKNVNEKKLSFKYPPNPLLNNTDSKHHIHNDLTESDNEENETLEEFWKRADIKLVQRLRMLQKKSQNLQ